MEADFLICLCELLAESKLKIAVVDNTKEAGLFSKLSFMRNEESLTYHKIEYKRNVFIFDEEDKFDFVFLKAEIFSQEKFYMKLDKWWVFLTPQREIMEKLAVSFSHIEEPIFLYIRDFCEYKITSIFIRKKWTELGGHFTGWYDIPFDTLDYEYRMRLQYEPVNEWKQFSKEMREVLIQTACHFTGLTQKEQRIIYQKVKRGKCRCR